MRGIRATLPGKRLCPRLRPNPVAASSAEKRPALEGMGVPIMSMADIESATARAAAQPAAMIVLPIGFFDAYYLCRLGRHLERIPTCKFGVEFVQVLPL